MLGRGRWLLAGLLLAPSIARADGGTVRASERLTECQVTVFTAPTPLRAGPVDVSVLALDAVSGRPLPDRSMSVRLWPLDRPDQVRTHAATIETATNKLLRSAKFDLPAPGRWVFEIQVGDEAEERSVRFEADVAEPLPRWAEMGGWIVLPIVPILLFVLHQLLTWRAARIS